MRRILVPVSLAALVASVAFAQNADPEQPPAEQAAPTPESTQAPPTDLDEASATDPATEQGETPAIDHGNLEALVISVSGRGGRWRAPGVEQWQPVQVDDVLPAGAQIDTGMRTEIGVRVGKNATLLISSLSSVTLAQIEETDGRLVTRALLTEGAADFKVDHVGLENDFVVITPSSTMAVKGTGFRVVHGPMLGTQIEGVRSNRVNAIEVGYFDVRTQVRMSGRALSNSSTPNPAAAALGKTIAPPPSASPADNAAASAAGSSQTQTLQNTQSVNVSNAAFLSVFQTLVGTNAGNRPGFPPPPTNPGQGAGPGSPSPGPGPLPGTPSP